jgi:PAS domain S-box-containing protein
MNKSLRVLLVEDSEDDAELLTYELERSGYNLFCERVDTEASMSAALDSQPWDIVIADYTLPSFSAPAALNLLKEKALDLPFIIVSGTIGEDIAVAAMKAGAHDYLMKGRLARLAPAVERELREASERRKRREAEQAVRRSEERFRALIENALDIITVLSGDGIIRYESPSLEKVLGYKPEQIISKNIVEYIHPEDRENVLNTLKQAAQNQNCALSIEFRWQHQNGTWRILEAVGKYFQYSDYGDGFVLSEASLERNLEGTLAAVSSIVLNARDITERKRSEEIRHALEKERELSEARFNFVSMMSHEFRNPLTKIMVASEFLKNPRPEDTEEQKQRWLNYIDNSNREMTRLLDDILTLTRVEVGKLVLNPEPLNLESFCSKVVEEMPRSDENQHTITFVSQGECQQAYLDKDLLNHILTNLLSNAIKYSPQGGEVKFELCCENGEAVIQIQDQGIGIPPDDQPRLFESFYRGRNVRKIPGTGLGLCIVKQFVDLHGGTITLNSQVGVGTTFIIQLPLSVTTCQLPVTQ